MGKNYLEQELDAVLQKDGSVWEFLQRGSLDGVWYWDLEKPDNEWMSPEFWKTLGYDPTTKRHDPAEWQSLIFKDDLDVSLRNFEAHCNDPTHPYDQVVRYHHADGSVVWIRCRGLAIRNADGKAIRMLGAHTDLTQIKASEESARAGWRAAELAQDELRAVSGTLDRNLLDVRGAFAEKVQQWMSTEGKSDKSAGANLLREILARLRETSPYLEQVKFLTQTHSVPATMERVALDELVSSISKSLKAELKRNSVVLDVGDLPAVRGDERLLQVFFKMVIASAVHAVRECENPLVVVSATSVRPDGAVEISVADNGPDLTSRQIERGISAYFDRADHIKGDLAPSICQRVAIVHDAEITLRNFGGKRAAIGICFPPEDPVPK